MTFKSERVAMVGAGISGLACAAKLQAAGLTVTVFEKSRGPGGRLTTRRRETDRFDHGAQYFTAQTPAFQEQVAQWVSAGVVAQWTGRFATWNHGSFHGVEPRRVRWVSQPRMSALGRHLAEGLSVHLGTRIVNMARVGDHWCLHSEDGELFSGFDAVLLCCPGPQALALLPESSPLSAAAAQLEYSPCWVAMVRYPDPVAVPFDGIRFEHPVLGWAARDSSKPGRAPGERWVIQTNPVWSTAQLERPADEVSAQLMDEWMTIVAGQPDDLSVHRWRYSLARKGQGALALFASEVGLGLCGDGLAGPRIEDAWRSGQALADRLLS